jgi:hypothetical protein
LIFQVSDHVHPINHPNNVLDHFDFFGSFFIKEKLRSNLEFLLKGIMGNKKRTKFCPLMRAGRPKVEKPKH